MFKIILLHLLLKISSKFVSFYSHYYYSSARCHYFLLGPLWYLLEYFSTSSLISFVFHSLPCGPLFLLKEQVSPPQFPTLGLHLIPHCLENVIQVPYMMGKAFSLFKILIPFNGSHCFSLFFQKNYNKSTWKLIWDLIHGIITESKQDKFIKYSPCCGGRALRSTEQREPQHDSMRSPHPACCSNFRDWQTWRQANFF